MALTYNKATRDLAIKGTITFNDGTQENIFGNDILNYSYSAQIGSEGLPLGSTEAASFSLEISNVGRKYTPEKFDNAEVHMFIGIKNGSDYVYSDFGVWHVEDSSAPEQSVSISISGYDALASRFAAVFTDAEDVYPTTIGDIALTVCAAANIPLKDSSFPNAAVKVEEMPKWTEGTTLRDILSYCAICAGGFARIALNGQLEIVSFADGATYTVDPNLYQTFTPSGGSAFAFNAIEAMLAEDAEEHSRFAVDESITANATNTIQIDYNPLLTETIVQSIVTELTGITMSAAELTWGGDPSVKCSDYFIVETLNGASTKMMVTAQSVSFEGGLSVTETCSLPTINTITSATYSTSTNMYDAQGNIRATRISGLDKKVITATTGHFENLTAETIETDTLVAKMLSAIELYAGTIKAGSVETDVLTSTLAKIVEATINKLTAGTITTDELYAALAEIMALKVDSLKANDIKTDKLAAALAAFTVISAGTADFDRATIEHLVANLFNLTGSGVMEDVFIHNLQLAYAQIVSAQIGSLVLQSKEGLYYEIGIKINEDGTTDVTAEQVHPNDTEIENGVYGDTQPIIATNITADNIAATSVKATQALINSVIAARIDVDQLFAREAFITKLSTSQIFGGESLEIIVGRIDEASERATKTFRQTTKPLDAESRAGDLWIDPTNGAIRQAAQVGFLINDDGVMYLSHLDDDGFHAEISTDDPYYVGTNFAFTLAEDGAYSNTPISWALVQDQSLLEEVYKTTTDIEYCIYPIEDGEPPEDYAGWHTTTPPQISGFYIWSRIATTHANGSRKYGNVQCLSTALGEGVTSVTEQYCVSDNKITAPQTGWVDGIVDRPEGSYVWLRSKLTFIDGSVKYTPAYCDTSWEWLDTVTNSANDALSIANAALKREDFERVVRVNEDGLHIGDNITPCEVLIDSASMNVVMNGSKLSTISDKFIRFGNMQVRKVAGGLAICVYNG